MEIKLLTYVVLYTIKHNIGIHSHIDEKMILANILEALHIHLNTN